MATIANDDINVIAAEICVQENLPVDDLRVHALELNPMTASEHPAIFGDTTKVPIYSATGSANAWNSSSNNYETADSQGVTYKDIVINQRKKRTVTIDELQILRTDVVPLLKLELENVARTMVDDVNTLITAGNFALAVNVGPASGFDSDTVIDLKTQAQIKKYPASMRKLALNDTYATALMKDPAIKNHNTLSPIGLQNNQLLTSFSKFDGGVYEMEQIPSAGNLVGFATNGCGIAIAMTSMYQNNEDGEYEQTILNWSGFNFLMRRHKVRGTGAIFFSIEAHYGFGVADEVGIVRATSA